MSNLSPIVLFVFNRPWHTQKTIEALQKNILAAESELFIYSDGARGEQEDRQVLAVRDYIEKVDVFKRVTIIKRRENWGLANSIIDGVTQILDRYGKIIVLEDDLVTSPFFLKYMNDALELYEKDEAVVSIHGYQYPLITSKNLPDTFLIKGSDCWGWATWSHGWSIFEPNGKKLLRELKSKSLCREANFNDSFNYVGMLKDQIKGKNDSWAVRWYMSTFLNNKLTLYPRESMVQNIGNDNSGVHCGQTNLFFIENLADRPLFLNKIEPIKENLAAKVAIENYFKSINPGLLYKVWRKIIRRVYK